MVKRAAYFVAAYVCLSDEASKYIQCCVSDLRLACISPFRLWTSAIEKNTRQVVINGPSFGWGTKYLVTCTLLTYVGIVLSLLVLTLSMDLSFLSTLKKYAIIERQSIHVEIR
jgi:hypothetical protein